MTEARQLDRRDFESRVRQMSEQVALAHEADVSHDDLIRATVHHHGLLAATGGDIAFEMVDLHRGTALVPVTDGAYRELVRLLQDELGCRIVGTRWQVEGRAA
jgi:hypothetical protein